MKISDHIYLYPWEVQTENNCNSILIDGKTPLLIDPGHLHRVPLLMERIKADGYDPGRIKAVICTHAHPDHFEGTLAFKDSRVKIGLSREEERFIEDVGRSMYLQAGAAMPEYRVDFHLRDGTLTIGRHELDVIFTPGHSPGSICLHWPRQGVLITGDLVFAGGVGRTDLPGGNGKELFRSIERIAGLTAELLVPGHGPVLRGKREIEANFNYVLQAFAKAL